MVREEARIRPDRPPRVEFGVRARTHLKIRHNDRVEKFGVRNIWHSVMYVFAGIPGDRWLAM